MSNHLDTVREIASSVVEQAQTSKRVLVAEGSGAVLGFAGAFVIDRPALAVASGLVGIGCALTGLANVEYQGTVQWQIPPAEAPAQ